VIVEDALFAMNPPVKYASPVVVAFPNIRLVIVEEAAFTISPPGVYESPVVVAPVTFRYLIVEDARTMIPPAPFGSIETLSDEVANLELLPPPQAAEPTSPLVMLRQPSDSRSILSAVVEATPLTVRAVVEADGKVEADVVVDVIAPPTNSPEEIYPLPWTASLAEGEEVPTPTDPVIAPDDWISSL
jgi:hypothetical protein